MTDREASGDDVDVDAPWRPDWDGPAPAVPAGGELDPPSGIDIAANVPAPDPAPASPWAPGGTEVGSTLLSANVVDERPPVGADAGTDDTVARWQFRSDAAVEDDSPPHTGSSSRTESEVAAGSVVGSGVAVERDVMVENDVVEVDLAPRRRRWVSVVAAVVLLMAGVVVIRLVVDGEEPAVDGDRLPEAVDERWVTSIGERFVLEAVVSPDAVVVATGRVEPGGVELTSFDAIDGTERWSRPLDSVATDLILVRDDLLVVSATREFAEGRYSFAIDPASGDEIWNRDRDGVVLSTPEMGVVGIVDSGRFPSTEPSLELIDLTTGATIPPIGGRLAGLRPDGDVIAIDDDGSVRTIDVSEYDTEDPEAELPSEIVATTSPDRRNIVELDGRYFAADDDVLVEVGFAADAGRVLLDRRPDDQSSDPLPSIDASSFFAQVDDRHAAMLGVNGSIGIELAGDELRVVWSADGAFELPRRVDGDTVAIEVVRAADGAASLPGTTTVELIDAATGDVLVDFEGLPGSRLGAPVDGVIGWRDVTGSLGVDPRSFSGTVVGIGLDGARRWEVPAVTAGPFLGERTLVVGRRDGSTTTLVFLDEGPRSRPG